MSLKENKAIIRRLYEAFNKQNLALLDEYIGADYVDHSNQLRGRGNVKQFYAMVFQNFRWEDIRNVFGFVS